MRSAFLAASALLFAAPAAAASFSASVANAPSAKFVAGDLLWACGNGACTAASPYGRPLILCQSLVKQTGPVEGFKADGVDLTANDLAKCNARARKVELRTADRR